jgi:hypothetical protein
VNEAVIAIFWFHVGIYPRAQRKVRYGGSWTVHADWDVFARMWHDDITTIRVSLPGMATAFGYQVKALSSENGDELGGWDSLRHGARIRSGDGELTKSDVSDMWNGC